MKAWEVVARLNADNHPRSGLVNASNRQPDPNGEDIFVDFPESGCMWVRQNGRCVSGWTYYGRYDYDYFGFFDRLRIRKAVRAWLARHPKNPVTPVMVQGTAAEHLSAGMVVTMDLETGRVSRAKAG